VMTREQDYRSGGINVRCYLNNFTNHRFLIAMVNMEQEPVGSRSSTSGSCGFRKMSRLIVQATEFV
jgi:hypothetical protein